jgi:hypothetical protein
MYFFSALLGGELTHMAGYASTNWLISFWMPCVEKCTTRPRAREDDYRAEHRQLKSKLQVRSQVCRRHVRFEQL